MHLVDSLGDPDTRPLWILFAIEGHLGNCARVPIGARNRFTSSRKMRQPKFIFSDNFNVSDLTAFGVSAWSFHVSVLIGCHVPAMG